MTELHSHHVFLFPLKWDYLGSTHKPLEFQTDLQPFHKFLTGKEKCDKGCLAENFKWVADNWNHRPYQLNEIPNYNEYNYYFDFVREVMYDLHPNLQPTNNNTKQILNHFEFGLPKYLDNTRKSFYCIEIEGQTYKLEIADIIFNIYTTGVGVLSFHLENYQTRNPDNILKINQCGRGLFPPFLRSKTNQATYSELAKSIWLEIDGKKYLEDFSIYKDIGHLRHTHFLLPAFIKCLFPGNLFSTLYQTEDNNHKIKISPVIGNRMFLVCWYGNTKLAKNLTAKKKKKYAFLRSGKNKDFWYKYLFVDQESPSCQNEEFYRKIVEKHSYTRWTDYQNLYGISDYSFVNLTSDRATLTHFNTSHLIDHTIGIYYKMAELVLVQRATILRFSDEVTHVSNLSEKDGTKKIASTVSSLYKQYIRFVNKIYFRSITPEQQGAELYDMFQDVMHVARDVKDLDGEIEELHRYVSLLEAEKRNARLEVLTVLAAIFLLPTFLTGFFGMNVFDEEQLVPKSPIFYALLVLVMFMSAITIYICFKSWLKKARTNRIFFYIFSISGALFITWALSPILLFWLKAFANF